MLEAQIWLKYFIQTWKSQNLIIFNKKNIKITHLDWLTLANLKYQCQKNYLLQTSLRSSTTIVIWHWASWSDKKMYSQNVMNIGSLNINDKLLITFSWTYWVYRRTILFSYYTKTFLLCESWKIIYWLIGLTLYNTWSNVGTRACVFHMTFWLYESWFNTTWACPSMHL